MKIQGTLTQFKKGRRETVAHVQGDNKKMIKKQLGHLRRQLNIHGGKIEFKIFQKGA